MLNLTNITPEVKAAIAFYISDENPPKEEREKHYQVLEDAGLIEVMT